MINLSVYFRHLFCFISRLHVHFIAPTFARTFVIPIQSLSTLIMGSKPATGAMGSVGSVAGRNVAEVFEKQSPRNITDKRTTRSGVKEIEENHKEKYLTMPLEEKRKVYKCGSRYTELEMVPDWQEYSNTLKGRYDKCDLDAVFEFDQRLNKKIALWRGDITSLEVDAIVNAANNSLLGGGGDVIHTVGPIGVNASKLESCYNECLKHAVKNGLRTVAFPCISTGIYGYDIEKATPVVLRTIRNWMNTANNYDKIDKLIFCVFLLTDIEVYEVNLLEYFPPSPVTPHSGKRKDKKTKESHVKETAKPFGLKRGTDPKGNVTQQAESPVKRIVEAKSVTNTKEPDVDSETTRTDKLETETSIKSDTELQVDVIRLETDTKTVRLGESSELKRSDSKDKSENVSSPVAKKKPHVWNENEAAKKEVATKNGSVGENGLENDSSDIGIAEGGDTSNSNNNDTADASSEAVEPATTKL